MVPEEVVREWIQQKHPHVDIVFGTHNVHMLLELLGQAHHTQMWNLRGELISEEVMV
jgi:tRNA-2-methylthio-N6-dimethylallyladenosine synthase